MKNLNYFHPRNTLKPFALALAAAAGLGLTQTQAAINVGATGSAVQTFDALPTVASGWSTITAWTGAPGDVTDAATMDAAVALLASTDVALVVGSSGTWTPSTNAPARFNTKRLALQTNPTTGVKGCLLMATLQNTSGAAINQLEIAYDFVKPSSGTEELAGLRCYYSMTGLAGSWTVIPDLCTATPGTPSALVNLTSTPWADTATLYVLWADDSSTAAGDSYIIDNVIFGRGADIKTFGLPSTLATVTGTRYANYVNTDITWYVPDATDVTTLAPTITLSGGASVAPASGVSQNFTNPVQYVVTAGDPLITKTYTVTVIVGPVPVPISDDTTPGDTDITQGVKINDVVGASTTGILVGPTRCHWSLSVSKNVIMNGNTFTNFFGGNQRTFSGAISGTGVLNIGSTGAAPGVTYSGSVGNTYNAPTTLSQVATLNKSSGDALRGTITMNNAASKMIWGANDQLNDATDLSLTVSGANLDISAKQDTINELRLVTGTFVQTGAGGILKVSELYLNGVQQPHLGKGAGDTFVQGTGYIDVGNSGPPVIATVPDKPASPVPTDGTTGLHPMFVKLLDWADSAGAATYDVYLWDALGSKPGTPTATVSLSQYAPTLPLNSNATYNWQVVAVNAVGPTNGDVWTFTTTDASYVSNVLTPWEPAVPAAGVRIDTFIPSGGTAVLVGLTQTHWGSGGFSRAVDLNGNTLKLDSGGGNGANYAGPISGNGTVTIQNNGQTIGGSLGNTYTGTTNVNTVVTLNKSSGNALCGTITGTGAVITWAAGDQINDASDLTLNATSILNLAGFSETIASLNLAAGASVATGTVTGGVLTVSALTVDTVVMGPGTYTSASTFVTGIGSVVVAGATNDYGTWATANAGGQAADLDFDNDGMSNGVEYFMGETGSTFTANPPVVNTAGVLTVTWPRDPDAVASFLVQVSDDLSVWTDIVPPNGSINETVPTQVTYTLPTGAAQKFCRLVVTP